MLSRSGRQRRAAVLVVIGVAIVAAAVWMAGREFIGEAGPVEIVTVQEGLDHPWDLAFDAEGRMVVTERTGRVLVFASGEVGAELLATVTVPDVRAELESGLMGIAIHGSTVYVCATRGPEGSGAESGTWRLELLRAELGTDGSLSSFEPLPVGPADGNDRHQGCAVEIGPDEHLWVTFGDANRPAGENGAQDPAALNGKVLRLTLDGSVPADAAFPSGAVSIGHRNPQGIAFGADGAVFEVEHGTDVNDEINLIRPGANYGYPCVTGAGDPGPIPSPCPEAAELTDPAWASGDPTLATSAIAVLVHPRWAEREGDLVVSTLKEEDLRVFSVSDSDEVQAAEVWLDEAYGRLRAVELGPDGALYVSTSNGSSDRILRLVPRITD